MVAGVREPEPEPEEIAAAASWHDVGIERRIATLMAFEAATLATMSFLHLDGILTGGSGPFRRTDAGIAEALICLALIGGAAALLRNARHDRGIATATIGFAILGFIIGLNFTIQGAGAVDIAYHATVLPLLLLTLAAVLGRRNAHEQAPLPRASQEPARRYKGASDE
jgi:hypothetical protein